MHLLKELVHRTTLWTDREKAFSSLCSRLADLHIPVEKEDKVSGEIVAQCLTTTMNAVLWRCWSDKLLLEVREIDEERTQINVFAIPNLLRFKVGQHEKTVDLEALFSRLFT